RNIIPSLDQLSSVWAKCDTIAFLPSLRNFRAQAVVNRDLTSISWFNSPPYSQGYHTGTMKIDGSIVRAEQSKWNAYGVERKAEYKGLHIHSDTRMVFEKNGIFWDITFTNETNEDISFELTQDVIGFFGKYETHWQWWYPLPSIRGNKKEDWEKDFLLPFKENLFENELVRDSIGIIPNNPTWPSDLDIMNSEFYETQIENNFHPIIMDKNSSACVSYTFVNQPESLISFKSGSTAKWAITVPAGESKKHAFVMTWGDDAQKTYSYAILLTQSFDTSFSSIKKHWEDKWLALFTPDNSFVSGNMPALETTDKRASRVYYISALTMLYLMNTNLPVMKRVVLTGGPSWGGSIMFFWDTTSWRTIGAVTDPEIMIENIKGWMTLDINKIYGRDYLSGNGVGYRYVANYWAIFQMLHEYLVITGNYDLLKEEINGKTILTHMDDMANNWKTLSMEGKEGYEGELYKLADFGGDKNALLEAVPNYKHIVVSFNAGYVGMMKRMSEIYAKLGEEEKSNQARLEASDMASRILKLYAGDGVWYGLFPNNEKFKIKHCLDFHFLGRYMSDELPIEIKEEMIEFMENELMTDTWMRAQSKDDIAAEFSDRPDHGPLGSYDGWPLNTMEAMYHMGYPEKAMNFYRSIYPVTLEGTWAQAHELWGKNKYNKNARVRIARRGLCVRDAASGIGFANIMLREFFGFAPKFMDDQPLDRPEMARSIRGKMYHVRYRDKFFTISSDANGLTMIEE
ncbi:hypothetical protein ACFLU5_17970, partial [Bacteroidota bacterium]